MNKRITLIACLLLSLFAAGCTTAPERNDWLYNELGEREGISELTATMLLNIAKDDRIAPIFEDTDINLLHKRFIQQFCVLSGGPCTYEGSSMYEAHRDLGLTSTDFNAVVEDLVDAMETQGISVSAQNRLLAQLAPMRKNIVGTEPPPQNPINTGLGDRKPDGYSAKPINEGL